MQRPSAARSPLGEHAAMRLRLSSTGALPRPKHDANSNISTPYDPCGGPLVSLEELGQAPASEDKSALLEALLTREDQDPLEMLNLQDLKKALTVAIAALPEKERL